ncbi:MAG: hypothetical protein WA849_07025 [Candidatus Udaeobacter sp.]
MRTNNRWVIAIVGVFLQIALGAVIYGLMLTAWGFASVFGPLLIAHMRETAGSYRGALHVIAGVMTISTVLPILVRPPRTRDGRTTETVSHPSTRAAAGARS